MAKRDELRAFWTAVRLLTRLPVPGGDEVTPPAVVRRSVVFYPLVGTLIGLLTATVLWVGSRIWPPWLAVFVALLVEAVATGALHEDALADFCDAFGGGWDREQVLRILKDSRLGSYGATALFLGIALRAGAMVAIDPGQRFVAIVAAATIGRLMIVPTMAMLPPVTDRASLAAEVGRDVRESELNTALLVALPGTILWIAVTPLRALLAAVLLWLGLGALVRWIRARIGGSTGDCLGCICYLAQLVVLLVAAGGGS